MLADLDLDVMRMIADILFNPLSPIDLLAYASCIKHVRSGLQASDNLFIGLKNVERRCMDAAALVKRSGSKSIRPTSMSFMQSYSFDVVDFDLMCYMARHGSLAELKCFSVFAPGSASGRPPNVVIRDLAAPWHRLVRLLRDLEHLVLDMCGSPFDLPALIDALSYKVIQDGHGVWKSSLVTLQLEDNYWFDGNSHQVMLDAIKEGRFPNLKSFRADSGSWGDMGTRWTAEEGDEEEDEEEGA